MFQRSRAPVSLGGGENQFCHKRVYCHEALHLKEKLQSAGSKQETVGWDTDEASDASTTEADLRPGCVQSRCFVRLKKSRLCERG